VNCGYCKHKQGQAKRKAEGEHQRGHGKTKGETKANNVKRKQTMPNESKKCEPKANNVNQKQTA
jgi:hypothetical protein